MTVPSRLKSADDSGSALMIAVMVVGVCLSLAMVGVTVAVSSTRASGVDRQRVLAVDAAEAGVDSAFGAIQSGGLAPPCSLAAATVKSGPDTASYGTTVAYYDAAGAQLGCTAAGVSGTPVQALIRSTAQTAALGGGGSRGVRTLEALVALTPQSGSTLTKAIFADGVLTFENQTTVLGNNGPDADIYSNTDVNCSNNENFAGSLYSQGSISISNSCSFAGNVWAHGPVKTNNGSSGTVAGFVKSATGTIALSGIDITGNLYAGGSIAYGGCSVAAKCFPNNSPGEPPSNPFPILRANPATLSTWAANGYAVVPYVGVCSLVDDAIDDDYSQAGHPVLLVTSCPVAFAKSKDISLRNDVAIFASGGFSSSGQVGFSSTPAGTERKLYWVVPYEAAGSRPCAAPGVTTDQQFSLSSDVDMLIYSPCNISFANNSTHIGQLYGGSDVSIRNRFRLQFRPLPLFGIDTSSLPNRGYTPSIVYKRETR